MMKKIFNRSGETITEVLVASLVVSLGVLLFAMMVQSSFNIIRTSEDRMRDIYTAESGAESFDAGDSGAITDGTITYQLYPGTTEGLIVKGDIHDEGVDIYENSKVETIKSYRK